MLSPLSIVFSWSVALQGLAILSISAIFDQFFIRDVLWKYVFGKNYECSLRWMQNLPDAMFYVLNDKLFACIGIIVVSLP